MHGHGGQDVAAELNVTAGPGQAQGLDEVALGGVVLADVERGPAGQPGELRGDGEQLAAHRVGERAAQERGGAFGQAGGDGVGLPVPAAVLGVPAAGLVGGVPQLVEVGAADLLAAGVVGGLVGGGDSQRVTGVVNADTAKPDPVRKSRRFTLLQNEVATRTASARSRGKSNPTSASGVSASPIPMSLRSTGRPSRSPIACARRLGTGHFGIMPRWHQFAMEVCE
uniref:Uncharacterized protein n=1 Tax=Streptomyces sp. F12 TaxID=1436084 RepID=V9Z8J0_9ACTN|nr:hypothetical protein pFRL6_346 [Streptomyces sp. F12]